MNIANNIKAQAKAHGLTVTQLAERMNVLQPQLSRTINNPRISLEDLTRLADIIGCKVKDFFTDEQEPAPIGWSVRCSNCGKEIKIRIDQ